MSTPALQFQQLLWYLEEMGVDSRLIAGRVRLDATTIYAMDPAATLSTRDYAHLYQQAAMELQYLHPSVAWGAGIGTDFFRFRCCAMICCSDLGAALERGARYDRLLQPLTGYGMRFDCEADRFWIRFDFDPEVGSHLFQPWPSIEEQYAESLAAIVKASGLRIWYMLIGWMIGRNPQVLAVWLSSPCLPAIVQKRLERLFGVPINFGATESAVCIPATYLEHRIVQTPNSLDAFLDDAVYNLFLQENRRLNVSATVKSLLTRDIAGQLRTIETVAAQLHMSSSNLRRRLRLEGTSYQAIKDQVRLDMAYRYLRASHLKIHEIAAALGFSEPSSFIRSFRNWSGLTPHQFRAEMSSPPSAEPAQELNASILSLR